MIRVEIQGGEIQARRVRVVPRADKRPLELEAREAGLIVILSKGIPYTMRAVQTSRGLMLRVEVPDSVIVAPQVRLGWDGPAFEAEDDGILWRGDGVKAWFKERSGRT
jgi:hypothetical protein